MDDIEDQPILSEQADKALQEFLAEQLAKPPPSSVWSALKMPEENWQLSQFWYDEATALLLAEECLRSSNLWDLTLSSTDTQDIKRIACVSCPSVYKAIVQLRPELCDLGCIFLFEFDKCLQPMAGDSFVYYDFNDPLNFDPKLRNSFAVVIADPPFLSEDCLLRFAQTVRALSNGRYILCTGATMSEYAVKYLGVRELEFIPKHANNLANEFRCFANFACSVLK